MVDSGGRARVSSIQAQPQVPCCFNSNHSSAARGAFGYLKCWLSATSVSRRYFQGYIFKAIFSRRCERHASCLVTTVGRRTSGSANKLPFPRSSSSLGAGRPEKAVVPVACRTGTPLCTSPAFRNATA